MRWEKSNLGNTVQEIVANKSGMTTEELCSPIHENAYALENMSEVVSCIRNAIQKGTHITVFGDYDVDGITATCILVEIIRFLGGNVTYRLPRRMTEGYGISCKAIKELTPGLLITVDNGIAAIEPIQLAKDLGFEVVVIDHHLAGTSLPNADVLVDPHVNPERNCFVDYCGAGLALKLTELILSQIRNEASFADKQKEIHSLYIKVLALAAIGTIADVMPLRGDNRWIVQKGLACMRKNHPALPLGLRTILELAGLGDNMTERNVGFKIGPMLNAPGRMLDAGAELSLQAMLAETPSKARCLVDKLNALNEERKEVVREAVEKAETIIANQNLIGSKPLLVIVDEVPEGIVGIVTGRLAEKYKTPCFVLTPIDGGNILKGSGRSYNGFNLKSLVDISSDVLLSGGGHAGAAGISLKVENFNIMQEKMSSLMTEYIAEDSDVLYYDLEISPKEIIEQYNEVLKYAPYGEGCPAPVFKVRNVILSPRNGEYHSFMGKHSEHVKLTGNGFSAMAFGLSKEYTEMNLPRKLSMVGTLAESTFGSFREMQIEIIDFKAETEREIPSLQQLLSQKAKL